jgi:hypothetical protein
VADGHRGAGHRARQRGHADLRHRAAQPAVAAGRAVDAAGRHGRGRVSAATRDSGGRPGAGRAAALRAAQIALGRGDAGRGAEPRCRAPDGHSDPRTIAGAFAIPRCWRALPAC